MSEDEKVIDAVDGEVIEKMPIDRIQNAYRNSDYRIKQWLSQLNGKTMDPQTRRSISQRIKIRDHEVATEVRQFMMDLTRDSLNAAVEKIRTQGFNMTSQEDLSAFALIIATAEPTLKGMLNGIRAVGEFGGVLKEGPNKKIKITGEQLGAVVARIISQAPK